MENKQLLQSIQGYKYSSAIIVAYTTGLLELLNQNAIHLNKIAKELNMNSKQLFLFLTYLKSVDVVNENQGIWYLSKSFLNSYNNLKNLTDIIYHEKTVFSKFITPEKLESSLKTEVGKRLFDYIGFTEKEQSFYDKTMFGKNLDLLSLYLYRELRNYKKPKILEYGRSKNYILQALKKTGYQFYGQYIVDGLNYYKVQNTSDSTYKKNEQITISFDLIILYNTIHYYTPSQFVDKIVYLDKYLNKSGAIIIIDLFFKKNNLFLSNILLDWMTHGDTNFLTIKELSEVVENTKYRIVRYKEIEVLNTTMCILKRENEITQ